MIGHFQWISQIIKMLDGTHVYNPFDFLYSPDATRFVDDIIAGSYLE